RTGSGPGHAPHGDLTGRDFGAVGRVDDERADPLKRDGFTAAVGLIPVLVGLEVTLEGLFDELDASKPFHGGDAVPARYDQPGRMAVLKGERFAIHRVGD